ncbi:MAG TPA: metallophosphoesterase [Deltaproteobacteria bacterium]|nr:metallophosphoesterase [Deltaproteobacteria bacterium]
MPMFLLVIFGLYSAVHVYAFLKVRAAFPFGTAAGLGLGLFMAVMVLTPILVRFLEQHGLELPAKLFACLGYTWMGVIFLFFSLSLLVDLYRLSAFSLGLALHRDLGALVPQARTALLVPLLMSLAIAVYGAFDALNIRAHRIVVPSEKIPSSVGRVRIVQISDVHLGLIVGEARLKRITEVVSRQGPDILVSTGDLVDGQIDNLSDLADALARIRPRYGSYAVTGNHEFYAGIDRSLEITRRAGFTVLRGEGMTIPGLITIAGVDDPTARRMGMFEGMREGDLLAGLPRDQFILFLKHQPHLKEGSFGLFDLQLSGHTHGGQIFPFRFLVKIFFPHVTGLLKLPGSLLYVSRGTGTWGPPIRVLSPPEVTVIDLVHAGPG